MGDLLVSPKNGTHPELRVRTTFGGFDQVRKWIVLCNPQKWDAPQSFKVIEYINM
jgi:hypothetical protein